MAAVIRGQPTSSFNHWANLTKLISPYLCVITLSTESSHSAFGF